MFPRSRPWHARRRRWRRWASAGATGICLASCPAGELQRTAIARALIHRPALILADEPTGNLDPETAAKVLALFAGQVRDLGAAVILVTHSDVAAAAADRTLVLTPAGLVPRHAA
jgi:putative ABC transport system ATP-binding protein